MDARHGFRATCQARVAAETLQGGDELGMAAGDNAQVSRQSLDHTNTDCGAGALGIAGSCSDVMLDCDMCGGLTLARDQQRNSLGGAGEDTAVLGDERHTLEARLAEQQSP